MAEREPNTAQCSNVNERKWTWSPSSANCTAHVFSIGNDGIIILIWNARDINKMQR